jgi:hypothetical protein
LTSPRLSTSRRGYGSSHQAARRLEPLVASGLAVCSRCGERIEAGAPFDLDHSDDRSSYLGPSHVSCNRGAHSRDGAPSFEGVVSSLTINSLNRDQSHMRRFSRPSTNGARSRLGQCELHVRKAYKHARNHPPEAILLLRHLFAEPGPTI